MVGNDVCGTFGIGFGRAGSGSGGAATAGYSTPAGSGRSGSPSREHRCVPGRLSALESDNEVALAKISQTCADNKDVAKFAELMEKDHEQIAENLERFTGQTSVRREQRGDKPSNGAQAAPERRGKCRK